MGYWGAAGGTGGVPWPGDPGLSLGARRGCGAPNRCWDSLCGSCPHQGSPIPTGVPRGGALRQGSGGPVGFRLAHSPVRLHPPSPCIKPASCAPCSLLTRVYFLLPAPRCCGSEARGVPRTLTCAPPSHGEHRPSRADPGAAAPRLGGAGGEGTEANKPGAQPRCWPLGNPLWIPTRPTGAQRPPKCVCESFAPPNERGWGAL